MQIDLSKYITGEQGVQEAAKSVRGLKSAVSALTKGLEEDGKRIEAGFAKIAATIQSISSKNNGLTNLSNDAEKKQLQDLIKELDSVRAAKAALREQERGNAAAQKAAADAASLFTKELKEQRAALKQAFDAGNVEGVKKAALTIQALKQDSEQLAKATRGVASAFTNANGSYNAAAAELASLRAELRAIGGGLDSAGKGFDQTNPRVAELNTRISQLDSQLKAADKAMGQSYRSVGAYAEGILEAVRALEKEKSSLTAAAAALKTQAQATNLTADQQARLQSEIKKTDAALANVNGQLEGYGVGVKKTGSFTADAVGSLKEYVLTVGAAYVSLQALSQGVQAAFASNVQYSDQLADVRKTTGLTADEAERLADSLKQIPTRTSLTGLLDIAKVGGQIGIAKDQILDFTQAVDVAVQALGDDFQGGAEQIATELGKIANVFKKDLGPEISTNLLAIGSAVNELGAQGAATAPFLTDVALRVGAVSAQTGVGLKNVLSYAAVLEETGFSSERAGTALNRLFSTLSTKTDASFRIARNALPTLTLKEFTKLVNTDFNAAIQLFLKGLNAGGKTTTELNKLLGTLKLQSGEAKNVIITLAQNTELFAERQRVANEQLQNGSSVAAEATIKNETLAGSWEKLKNNILATVTNGRIATFFKGIVDFAAGGIFAVEKLNKTIADNANETARQGAAALVAVKQNQELLTRYQQLAGSAESAAFNQKELQKITLQLKDSLGDSVVSIDKQTGAYVLNQAAVQRSIDKGKEQNKAEALRLAQTLSNLNKQKDAEERIAKATSKAIDTRITSINEYGKVQADQVQRFIKLSQEGSTRAGLGLPVGFTPEQIANVKGYQAETEKLSQVNQKIIELDQNRIALLKALLALGYSAVEARALLNQTVADGKKPLDEDTEALGGNTAELNRNAKAQAELQKARLQAQLAAQERSLEELKKFQEEQGKLFEDKQINRDIYAATVAESGNKIEALERAAAQTRIAIARQEANIRNEDAKKEYATVLRQKEVSNEEIADAQAALNTKLKTSALQFSEEILKINDDLSKKLEEKPIEFKLSAIDPKKLLGGTDSVDELANKGLEAFNKRLQKQQEDTDRAREDQAKKEQEDRDRRDRLIQEGVDFAINAEQAYFDYVAQQNYARLNLLEEARQRELAAAGDNAELRLKIEQDYNEKIRQAKRKAAEDNRRAAIFEATINTAVGITKTILEFGFTPAAIPFVALAAATGALQIAAILSTPIPQYFKGRNGGPAEFAEVAERGPELIETPGKGMRLASKRGIAYLNQNDIVYTAERTREILRTTSVQYQLPEAANQSFVKGAAGMQDTGPTLSAKELEALLMKSSLAGADRIAAAYNKRVQSHYQWTPQGIMEVVKKGNSTTYVLGQRLKTLGRS